MTDSAEKGRLFWQCRRGIKEVEVLLIPFFERFYDGLPADRQVQFQRLLDCHDADLFEWFTERASPDDDDLRDMVNEILRALAA